MDRNGTDKPRLDFYICYVFFFMRPAVGGRIKCCNPSVRPSFRPSVPCLRFTRNRKAVESSLFGGDVSLDRSNWGRKFEVERSKIKVTGNEKWIDLHQTKTNMIISPFYTIVKYLSPAKMIRFLMFVCLFICHSHTSRLNWNTIKILFIFYGYLTTYTNASE